MLIDESKIYWIEEVIFCLFLLILFFNFILSVSGYKSKNNWRQNTFNDYLLEKQRRQCYW